MKLTAVKLKVVAIIALLILSPLISLSVGPANVGLGDIVGAVTNTLKGEKKEMVERVVFEYRLPRTILAMLVGIALASSGCAMQALFRNPLADPYILGVSSGASVGAAVSIVFGIEASYGIILPAFLFSLLSVYVVYSIGRDSTFSLLLAGVAVGSFLSGLTSLLIYLSANDMHKVVFWIMGGFWTASWSKVFVILPSIAIALPLLLLNSWNLNAILMGEEHAVSVGVDVGNVKRVVVGSVALLTAAAVSVSGIIGFVGIIIPHTMRLMFGDDNRVLMPASILFAAGFMPGVDVVAKNLTTGEVPIGILTSMLGAPFFVYLLRRERREWNG